MTDYQQMACAIARQLRSPMTTRNFDHYSEEIKRVLGERRVNGCVFGVCTVIAERSGWELWVVRCVAICLLLVFTLFTALAYFVLAMLFRETRPGAQRKLTRWARRADDFLEVFLKGVRGIMTNARRDRHEPPPRSGHTDA